MDGVISLLADEYDQRLRALWGELEADFGVRGVYVTPYPHFSYHVASAYAGPAAEAALRAVAGRLTPFTITTAGLGVFTGPAPVLYLPIVRTAALSAAHAQVWEAVDPHSTGAEAHYRPEQWLPHITLGFGDIQPETLGRLMTRLGARRFDWTIPIRTLSLIVNGDERQVLHGRVPLGGGP